MHNKVIDIYFGNQIGSLGPSGKVPYATFSNLPLWFYLLAAFTIIFFLSLIMFLAPWLRGSKWINKKNPYIEGQTYVRTATQRIVFRLTTITFALLFLSSFFGSMFLEDVIGDDINGGNITKKIWEYILNGVSSWYYQCFLSSLFIGVTILFKKYKFMLIVWPIAFMGALRTFADITDVGDELNYTSINFWRFWFEHSMLIFVPLFIAISQRQRYTLKTIANTAFFTFMMVFVAYVMYLIIFASKSNDLKDWGEIKGLGIWFGYEDKWLVHNFSYFFWLIEVPFGLGVTLPIIFFYRFFETKSRTEGGFFKRWIKVWRLMWEDAKVEGREYMQSKWVTFFTRGGKQLKAVNKVVPFGTDPDWFYGKEKLEVKPTANKIKKVKTDSKLKVKFKGFINKAKNKTMRKK